MIKNNYFILTGAMGAGKSTVLKKLSEKNYLCVEEPAREVLSEQRKVNGEGIPEKNPELFNELMLERMISQYNENLNYNGIIIYDRGIADLIAYAELFKINIEKFVRAAQEYRYNEFVFMFNGWEKIYATDDERKVGFETANDFGLNLRKIYENYGYKIIDVPFVSVEERVLFIEGKTKSII